MSPSLQGLTLHNHGGDLNEDLKTLRSHIFSYVDALTLLLLLSALYYFRPTHYTIENGYTPPDGCKSTPDEEDS